MKTAALIGSVVAGVFVGALLIRLVRPSLLRRLGDGAIDTMEGLARGFREEYRRPRGGTSA